MPSSTLSPKTQRNSMLPARCRNEPCRNRLVTSVIGSGTKRQALRQGRSPEQHRRNDAEPGHDPMLAHRQQAEPGQEPGGRAGADQGPGHERRLQMGERNAVMERQEHRSALAPGLARDPQHVAAAAVVDEARRDEQEVREAVEVLDGGGRDRLAPASRRAPRQGARRAGRRCGQGAAPPPPATRRAGRRSAAATALR